ncbi:MAG: rRNA maturation RNase YbeY [Thiobacillaceae bacterium]|nr:rRNA maturation RNase YbeY [Thiobacillaceae bacterium]
MAAGEKDRRPRLGITVQYAVADRTGLPSRALLRRWAQAALVREAEVTLRFVDEAEGRRLNRDFRGKDYATNVLTFTYPPDPSPLTPHASPLTGDLVLCAPVIAREAAEQGKSLMAHYAHLVVHGLLHLQGYDHERRTEAVAMEAVERFILMRLGYPDPYVAR